MKNIKHSVIGLLGVSLVIGAIIFDSSRSGRAATSNANKSEVVVVNNVDNPVISRVVGTTPVSISGTPTVNVDSSAPVQVRDVTVRQPITERAHIVWAITASTGSNVFTVPAGKRLVIEYVTAHLAITPGYRGVLSVYTMVDGVLRPWWIPLRSQGTFLMQDFFETSELVRIHGDPGTSVSVKINLNDDGSDGTCEVTFQGYLEDVP
jgi:hypothetical protein